MNLWPFGKRKPAEDPAVGYRRGYENGITDATVALAQQNMGELGAEGLVSFAGRVTEPYLDKLRWPEAYTTYDEMRRRDPTLRSIIHVTKLLAKTTDWKVETATDQPGDREAGDFLGSCLDGMSHTMGDFVDDALTAIPFGWSSFEEVYQRRSDGRIGWRKLAYRRQSSFQRWLFDDNGGFQGWVQTPAPSYREITLPIDRLLHVVLERDGNNPEGMSLFESAYECWHFVVNLQVISGIGWQRAFVGLPVFRFKERPAPGDDALVKAIGQGLQVGAKQYVSTPQNIEFGLESTSNSGADSLLNTIRFYRTLMTQLVMADYILMGMGGGGSWSLGSDKSSLFLMAIDGMLDRIQDCFNQYGVRRLFEYNAFTGMTAIPRVSHTKVQKIRLGDLGAFVQQIANYIPMYESDAVWLREQAGMPQPAADAEPLEKPGATAQTTLPWQYPAERAPVGEASEFQEATPKPEDDVEGLDDPADAVKVSAAEELRAAIAAYFAGLRKRIVATATAEDSDAGSAV
jgi:hypothetical protein